MSQLVWLDLCSGLGGASQPALDRGWKVIRVDIDPRFKPDIVADVCGTGHLLARLQEHGIGPANTMTTGLLDGLGVAVKGPSCQVDVFWASPVCTDFAKWGMRNWYPEPPDPDMSLSIAVKRALDWLKPRYWIVENVRASRRFLNPLFGRPLACGVGHALWGSIPGLLPPLRPHKGGRIRDRRRTSAAMKLALGMPANAVISDADMSALRAKIPYEIGEAICIAVERRAEEKQA